MKGNVFRRVGISEIQGFKGSEVGILKQLMLPTRKISIAKSIAILNDRTYMRGQFF